MSSLHPGVRVGWGLANIRTNRRCVVCEPQIPHGRVVSRSRSTVVQLDGIRVLHLARLDAQADVLVGDGCKPVI